MIKFVSDLRHVGSFLWVVSATNKTDRHDISEILLKVALNTITLSPIKDKENKITSLREILTKTCIYI